MSVSLLTIRMVAARRTQTGLPIHLCGLAASIRRYIGSSGPEVPEGTRSGKSRSQLRAGGGPKGGNSLFVQILKVGRRSRTNPEFGSVNLVSRGHLSQLLSVHAPLPAELCHETCDTQKRSS